MACGTPIVGYDNEAFRGVVGTSGVGWLSPLDEPELLAAKIAELNQNHQAVVAAARSCQGPIGWNIFSLAS